MKNLSQKPDFIGIGASKAGSTWIYSCLREHLEICVSTKKEISFFNKPHNYNKGIDYYQSFFKNCPKKTIKGEITPNYINSPQAPKLIYKHFPNIKIIACLRNPIDKIYSHFRFHKLVKEKFSNYKTFEEAIEKDPVLIEWGYYYIQLKKNFLLFPRNQILILIYDDLKSDPIGFIRKVYEFLGVKNIDFIPSVIKSKANVTGNIVFENKIPILDSIIYRLRNISDRISWLKKLVERLQLEDLLIKFITFNRKPVKSKQEKIKSIMMPMKIKTREYLYYAYKDDIRKLESLIDRDLSFWKYF